jgi:hypothetical protein
MEAYYRTFLDKFDTYCLSNITHYNTGRYNISFGWCCLPVLLVPKEEYNLEQHETHTPLVSLPVDSILLRITHIAKWRDFVRLSNGNFF